jgi:outer membrane protein TolC
MQFENKRPEYQLFDLQQQRVGTLKSMVITKWNPKIFAYGQAGYGRPGLNMLNDDFSPWWIVGAKLTWNFWNWNQNRNERQILDIQSDIIRTQKKTFDKNLRISAEKDISEILRLSEVVQQDEEIIALREKITKTSSSQLDNGIITSSEYISRLNEEVMAKIAWELHRIQLVKAKQSYLFTLGKL